MHSGVRQCAAFVLASCVVGTAACHPDAKPVGQLVVSIETDMALPDQIDDVHIEVNVPGYTMPWYSNDFSLRGNTGYAVPATFALLAGPDKETPATITVVGMKGARARTLREVTTNAPRDRQASLRMPIEWLCDDSAKKNPDPPNDHSMTFVSTCDPGFACKGGECVESPVKEAQLPDYKPEDVFGGAEKPEDGRCFDTVACMTGGDVLTPDDACTVLEPAGGLGVNVALAVTDDGICSDDKTRCFVPLNGNSDSGWVAQDGRLKLPTEACARFHAGRVNAIVATTRCPTKTEAVPPCGSWSSVPASRASVVEDAGAPPVSQVTVAGSDGGASAACCPLFADDKRLYMCRCGESSTDLLGIDPAKGSAELVARIAPVSPVSLRYPPVLASAFSNGALFWTDRATDAGAGSILMKTVLSTRSTNPLARVDYVYDHTLDSLLSDATHVYALTSGGGVDSSGVQVLAVDEETGDVASYSIDSGYVLPMFAQGDDALYVASQPGDDGGTSTVVHIDRIAKAGGKRTPIADLAGDANALSWFDIAVEGTTLVTVERDPTNASSVNVVSLDLSDPGVKKKTLASINLAKGASLGILGVVDGAVLLTRTVRVESDAGSARDGALLVIPSGGGFPRIPAELSSDAPIGRALAPSFDDQGVYFLTGAGSLYRVARSALR